MGDQGPRRDGAKRRSFLKLAGSAAIGGTAALAGCNGGKVQFHEFSANPMRLSMPVRRGAGYPAVDHSEETVLLDQDVLGVKAVVSVTSHVNLYEVDAGGDPELEFPVAVLSTPTADVAGSMQNPLATDSMKDVLTSDRGRALLDRANVVGKGVPRWKRGPQRIDSEASKMLGSSGTIEAYAGVVEAAGNNATPRGVVVFVQRAITGNNAVIAAGLLRHPLSNGVNAFLSQPSDFFLPGVDDRLEQMDRITDGVKYGKNIGSVTLPQLLLSNAKLVQTVSDTEVDNAANTTVPDPDLVDGQNTAVTFDLTANAVSGAGVSHEDWARAVVSRDFGTKVERDWFGFSKYDLEQIHGGADAGAVMHDMAFFGVTGTAPPVFEMDRSMQSVSLDLHSPSGHHRTGSKLTIGRGKNADHTVERVPLLKVGVLQVRDPGKGSNYGDANGFAKNFARSFHSHMEYVSRTFPGGVVGYSPPVYLWGKANSVKNAYVKDHRNARAVLERAPSKNYFSGGRLFTQGISDGGARAAIKRDGFDVWVLINPQGTASGNQDYYDYHGKDPNLAGQYLGSHKLAVGFQEARASSQDRFHAAGVAQEIGHFMKNVPYDGNGNHNHPLAQRDDDGKDATVNGEPVDRDHARDADSDHDGDGTKDAPGLSSVPYDLTDGDFLLAGEFELRDGNFDVKALSATPTGGDSVPRVESYMSYAGNPLWADAKIHQDMIDSGFRKYLGNTTTVVVSATGRRTDEGAVEYDDVQVFEGTPLDATPDDDATEGPVEVELLAPDGESLVRATVEDTLHVHHHTDERVDVVQFDLPFPETAVSVRTVRRGTETRFNPITRPIRDAVDRVPDRGFEGDPAEARDRVDAALARVDGLMDEKAFSRAGEETNALGRSLAESIRTEYEDRGANQPNRTDLRSLVEDATSRLATVAERY